MIKKIAIALLFAAVLAGCGKDEVQQVSMVITKTECYKGGSLEYGIGYSYDSKGNLTDILNYSALYDHGRTVYYSPESITILGSRGASIINVDQSGTPEKIISSEGIIMCTFGSDGYLKQFNINSGESSYTLTAQAQNGNFVSLQDFNRNTLKIAYTQYENNYSIDLNNVPQIDNMFTMFNTLKISGMWSRNLIKSVETKDATYYFTYNFDGKGRVSDMIVVSTASENALTEHYKFTY